MSSLTASAIGQKITAVTLVADKVDAKDVKPVKITGSALPSGANQGASGAGAGEVWVDTSAGNALKLGV